jgi:O-antigen/teichoic acid export membrane protein
MGIKALLLFFHASLIWFVISLVVDAVLLAGGYIVSYQYKKKPIRKWRFNKHVASYLIKQSFPLVLSSAAVVLYQRIDQVLIGNMIDKTAVGEFAVATTFAELIAFIPFVMSQTIVPLLVRIRETNCEEYIRKRQLYINVITWSSVVVSILVSLLAHWIVLFTYGIEYMAAVPVLQIMAFKAIGMALSSSSGQLIIIEGIHRYAFIRNVIGAILCVVLNLWLIPIYGIVGSAIVTILTILLSGFLSNALIPPYRAIFVLQIKAIMTGWRDIINLKMLMK